MAFIKSGGFVMKFKIFLVLVVLVSIFSMLVVPVSATAEIEFTVDVNERYTDISYIDETNAYGEIINSEEDEELQSKKTVYIAVLSILLVISIVVLVVTLKRAKEDKLLSKEEVSGTRD